MLVRAMHECHDLNCDKIKTNVKHVLLISKMASTSAKPRCVSSAKIFLTLMDDICLHRTFICYLLTRPLSEKKKYCKVLHSVNFDKKQGFGSDFSSWRFLSNYSKLLDYWSSMILANEVCARGKKLRLLG